MSNPTGLIYVFTGEGKGKTSAALGTAIRALANGMKVAIVQWYKTKSWGISEHEINKLLNPEASKRFQIHPLGIGFYINQHREADHKKEAAKALQKATEIINTVDVLILDEVNNAVSDKLIDVSELKDLISKRGKTHLILTGRNVHKDIISIADLVTSMEKIKHPYDQGKLAVKGLDF